MAMLTNCRRFLVRRKWGQRAWSPTATSGGAAPGNGVSAQEALRIAYRPMPPQQTVEYEEDFGHNLMIHREFVSRRHRDQMSFDVGALGYSEVERRRGQQHLAGVMNRERRGVLLGAAGAAKDQVHFETDVDTDTREVRSARYLFDERRLQFCDRFQSFFEGHVASGSDTPHLFSLMEACAVIYGCETDDAREAYYQAFLALDLNTLEEEDDALRGRLAEAALLRRELAAGRKEDTRLPTAPDLSLLLGDGDATPNQASPPPADKCVEAALPDDLEEYASLYRAYLAYARGESRAPSFDITTLGSTGATMERRRWRALMEKVVREEYHTMTETEKADALVLNEQLHTIKFFDLRLGDTVREILQLLQRGDGSSADRSDPLHMSSNSPERRT